MSASQSESVSDDDSPKIPPLLTLEYYQCAVLRGRALILDLDSIRAKPLDPSRIRSYKEIYNPQYGSVVCKDRKILDILEPFGIGNAYHYAEVYQGKRLAYLNWANRHTILAKENNSSQDPFKDTPKETPRLFGSEILYQTFMYDANMADKKTRDPNRPRDLKIIAQCDVYNASTRTAVWFAERSPTHTITESRPDGYRVYTSSDEGFFALVGCENGRQTIRVAVDHKHELGYKTLEKVIVAPSDRQNDEEAFRS